MVVVVDKVLEQLVGEVVEILGHCGIAVRTKDKWLLHAGDAYFFHGQIQASPKMPLVLGMFQRRADMDRALRVQNQERLRTLKANHGDAVTIFNSHDAVDYENCRCGQHPTAAAHNRP